ncbi:branched-chain amino acid ABC transporter permease [Raineyella sp. W15-4]|uniref:branched-chain amino acid ABC transporter permease n=1 Tax=Raineyella sp. W15-4 TaxID=3081651 RepID=UPI002955D91C|nr:branched-chain amino acid ABC transporter permease [Raineyella sp. W15-4]WOQ17467.1 branched-chain amino acid ABC transporter permease [Raineyella sp. W15-4]
MKKLSDLLPGLRGGGTHRFGPTATPKPLTAGLVLLAFLLAPAALGGYGSGLVALYLPLVLLALSADLLWGLNGVVSFGHAAFFTAGAYLAALIVGGPGDSAAGTLSYLQATNVGAGPGDVWRGVFEALAAVRILGVSVLALLLPAVVVGLFGLVLGLVLFRLPSPEVYVPLMTLGLGVIMTTSLVGVSFLGASNGLSNIPSFVADTWLTRIAGDGMGKYYFNLLFLVVAYGVYWWFRGSSWGRRWLGSGDSPLRLDALGYRANLTRSLGFGASAALAGFAGALYVGSIGFVAPAQAAVGQSAMVLIWVAVGRPGSFFGPLVGVLTIQISSFFLSGVLKNSWQLVLGVILILVVVLMTRAAEIRAFVRRTVRRAERPPVERVASASE